MQEKVLRARLVRLADSVGLQLRADLTTRRMAEIIGHNPAVRGKDCLLYIDASSDRIDFWVGSQWGAMGSNWEPCSFVDAIGEIIDALGDGYTIGHDTNPCY